jgi:hypothetical protein
VTLYARDKNEAWEGKNLGRPTARFSAASDQRLMLCSYSMESGVKTAEELDKEAFNCSMTESGTTTDDVLDTRLFSGSMMELLIVDILKTNEKLLFCEMFAGRYKITWTASYI